MRSRRIATSLSITGRPFLAVGIGGFSTAIWPRTSRAAQALKLAQQNRANRAVAQRGAFTSNFIFSLL